ncbi:MAG: LysE family transporter [Deinococcales bacterium]
MTAALVQGAALGLSAAMLPGPFQAYVVSESARRGWQRTLPVALAPLLSDGPVLVLVFLVVSRLPDTALEGLRLAGGLFIAYLAYGALRSLLAGASPQRSGYGGVLKGAVMNLLNPNPWLFWGLVGAPIVVAAWQAAPPHALGFMVAFYAVMVGVTGVLIVVFGSAAALGPRLRQGLLGLSVVALAAFAAVQLVVGVSRLLA